MASAQVLPNSRKQEHLQAGKRRLEEFRKKKAAERAKKGSSNSQINGSEVSSNEKQPLESELVRVTVSDGAGTSDGPSGAFTETSSVFSNNDSKAVDFSQKKEQTSLNNPHTGLSTYHFNSFSADQGEKHVSDQDYKRYGALGLAGPLDVNHSHATKGMNNDSDKYTGTLGGSDQSIALHTQASQDFDSNTSLFSYHGRNEFQSKEHNISLMDSISTNSSFPHPSVTKTSPQNSVSALLQSEASNVSIVSGSPAPSSFYEDSIEPNTSMSGFSHEVGKNMHGSRLELSDPMTFRFGEGNLSSSATGFSSVQSAPVQTSESMGIGSDTRNSSNHASLYSVTPENNSRRSRPSFLDSLVPRASGGVFQQPEPEKPFMSNTFQSNGMNFLSSSPFHKPSMDNDTLTPFSTLETGATHAFEHSVKSSLSPNVGMDQQRPIVEDNSMGRKHEFYSPNQNEDFSALEQHIEDLTQEKFSLQRELESSRTLAESLAAENSSLTESYNQQRSVVNQLKSELENIQEEIKAHLVELEAVRNEYGNAQLECNAADERAKLLASEVIGLEEKARKLRYNELKLERQLENTQAEISSYKKRISSLEKDRSDLQSTISALQEEKKLLQSMLRKASTGGKKADVSKSTSTNKDVSTSTEDLVEANEDAIPDTLSQERGDDSSAMLPTDGQSTFDVSSVNLPPDQMRTIENINTLISELALEKEGLIQSLASESSHCSKLKELNNELSRKLEAQTQRLELLTAQSMANENSLVRQPTPVDMPDSTPYADEGDEVVERVLGWIMKLFPGGPSRRRTSKLL